MKLVDDSVLQLMVDGISETRKGFPNEPIVEDALSFLAGYLAAALDDPRAEDLLQAAASRSDDDGLIGDGI